jgi:uncharacterized protein (TIGR00269 family)
MKCFRCDKSAIIQLQHGALCKHHFLSYFEDKVFKTINRFNLIGREEKICVACSGGKDSQVVLHLTKKYLENNHIPTKNLWVLAIDEGIKNYRNHTLVDLKKFCKQEKVALKIVTAKQEFNYTLDSAIKKDKQQHKPCHLCGVWRRYLLNKYARKYGAHKIITGHNLDDEAQAITMNMFKANTTLMSHLGPMSGLNEHPLFVRRVKPLYLCPEKEIKLYSLLKGFPVHFSECPYAEEGYRAHIRDMLNDFESKYKGTKQGIINSFLFISPLVREREIKDNKDAILICKQCGEPGNQEVCQACKIKESLNAKKTKISSK